MNKRKMCDPQDVPAIFRNAADEENWLIFAIGKADEKGKRAKRPVLRDRPYVWVNRDKAASFTLTRALKRLQEFRDWPGGLAEINRKAAERRAKMIEDGKKPGPEIEVEDYALGYFPREESALVALDFDNVVRDRVILDFEIGAMIEETGAYAEISSSGTGLRVFMPRVWGDDTRHAGEKNDVGFFVSAKGAACALTFDTIADGVDRDDRLFDLVIERHGAVADREEREDSGDVADQVLDHGRVEVDTFLGMIPAVRNDDRFDSFDEWIGMIRGPREYFEVVDPDRLDEVREALEAWCETWEGGDHDADKFEDVWERKPRAGSRAGLGSWVHFAQEGGWTWPEDRIEPREPWHKFPAPPAVMETLEDFEARFVLIDGVFFDRLHNREVRSLDQFGSLISELPWKKPKTAKSINAAIKYDQARKTAQRFTEAAFMPGEPEEVRDRRPRPSGGFDDSPGARVYNLWSPIRISEGCEAPEPWIEHVRRLYGAEGEVLIDWLAFVVQFPGRKVGWSPILIGPQGCGKDTIIAPVVNAMGRCGIANLGLDAMEQQHNGWLETALLVVMQENIAGRMAKANVTEKLKTMIAAPPDTLPLRKMQRDTVQVPNVLNLVFLTNHIDTIYMENAERRFWPIATEEVPEEAYFERLWGWMKAGGVEAVLGYLARRRITRVRERSRAPDSAVKRAVVEANLPEGAPEVLSFVEDRRWVTTQQIRNALQAPSEFGGVHGWRMSDKGLAQVLDHAGFKKWLGGDRGRVSFKGENGAKHHMVYVPKNGVPPSLDEMREALKAGSGEMEKSQRGPTLVGGTDYKGGTDKIL